MQQADEQLGRCEPRMMREKHILPGLNLMASGIIMYFVMFTIIWSVFSRFNKIDAFYMAVMLAMPMGNLKQWRADRESRNPGYLFQAKPHRRIAGARDQADQGNPATLLSSRGREGAESKRRARKMASGWRAVLLAGIFAGISACGRPESVENQQGTPAGSNFMANEMLADASNPFARAELAMTDELTAAVGSDLSDTWLHKMVAHQRGAIGMAEVLLEQGGDARLLDLAQRTIDKLAREQVGLQRLMGEITADPASARPYAEAETHVHEAMMAASGRDASETWGRKMVEHHRGAIALSEIVLARGENEQVKAKAREIVEERRKDITELEKLLSSIESQSRDRSKSSR